METEKYLTLISGDDDASDFTVNFTDTLTLGEDWEVALVQAYLPHRDFNFSESFKKHFPNNKFVGGLSVHYNHFIYTNVKDIIVPTVHEMASTMNAPPMMFVGAAIQRVHTL